MYISNKHASIESIPLKLVVISIITSITIQVLWSAYSNYSTAQVENNLKLELEKIIFAIKQVYLGANGTSLKLKINLEGIEYLKLGDTLGTEYSTLIKYKVNGCEQTIPVSEDAIQVTSDKNTTLILYSGTYTLLFTHINIGKDRYVEVKNIFL